jgi:hypothetical protein
LGSKSAKQAEKRLAILPTILSNRLFFAAENAREARKNTCLGCMPSISAAYGQLAQIRRFCYPDHRFSRYFGPLSCSGRQGKDGRSIKSWLYGLKDFEVLRSSRRWRFFTCERRAEYFPNGQS